MDVYKSTFYFTVYILFTLRIFAVGLSVLVYLIFVCRALSVCLYFEIYILGFSIY